MTFRILSLDGGGPWALIQVRTLMALDGNGAQTTGHEILRAFDLVVANSGGSIVLGGLLEDRPLGELIQFFKSKAQRKAIFSPTESMRARLARYFLCLGPLYSTDAKLAALLKLLEKHGREPLSTAAASVHRENGETRLLIVSFDYDRNRARLFRSYASGPSSPRYAKTSVAEAIHASSNAPVNYFDKPASFESGRYWDGAMTGCNNPVLVGVTEAIATGQKPTDIVALSLGTGTVARPWQQPGEGASPYFQTPGKSGLFNDVKKAAGAILDDPPDMATYVAHCMTGGSDGVPSPAHSRVARMSPLVSPVKKDDLWKAPGTMTLTEFNCFADIDMDAQEQWEIEAIDRYATLWIDNQAYNQPVKMNGDNLACECGDRWFSDALESWKAVR